LLPELHQSQNASFRYRKNPASGRRNTFHVFPIDNGLPINFIRQHNQHFDSYNWKDSHRARQLLNVGLQQIGENPNVDDLLPIVKELINLLPIDKDQAETILFW